MTALVLAVQPVDDFDSRRADADHHYRFRAIPSFVDLVGAPFRVVLVGGPSRVMPFARSRLLRGPSLLVDGINVHLTPLIGSFGAAAGGQGRKETSATTMIVARRPKVKRGARRGKGRGLVWQGAPMTGIGISHATHSAREIRLTYHLCQSCPSGVVCSRGSRRWVLI